MPPLRLAVFVRVTIPPLTVMGLTPRAPDTMSAPIPSVTEPLLVTVTVPPLNVIAVEPEL